MYVNSTFFSEVKFVDSLGAYHDLSNYAEFAVWLKDKPEDDDADAVAIGQLVVDNATEGEAHVIFEAEDLTKENKGQLWHSIHARTVSGYWLPLGWGIANLHRMAGNPGYVAP